MMSGVALETLLDKVADTYREATVADCKALREVINWLRGDANTDEATQQHLVALLHGHQTAPADGPALGHSGPAIAAALKLKPLPE